MPLYFPQGHDAGAAVRRVRDLHKPSVNRMIVPPYSVFSVTCDECSAYGGYDGESVDYPCPTIRALAGRDAS